MTLTQKQEDAIREVKQFIDSVPLQRIPVAELMQRSGLSEEKLRNGFKEMFGEKLYNYQVRLSMIKAAELLQQGLQVKSVAIIVGYSSPGNFTRAFKSIYNVTPSQYQTEFQQQ